MKITQNKKNIIKVAVFIVSLAISIVILSNLFTNPLNSSEALAYPYLLILFAICAYLGLSILGNFISFSQNRWVFFASQLVLTIVIPIFLMLLIEHALQRKIMAKVSQEVEPTLKYIQTYKKQNGILPSKVSENKKVENLVYLHNNKFYMLKVIITSIDKSGETIYYDSKNRSWFRFHKDQYEYFKDKTVIPPNIKNYIWLEKNIKN